MMFAVEFLIILVVLLGSWLGLRGWKCKNVGRSPPSIPSLPIVGSLPFLRGFDNPAEFFMKKGDQLGAIFSLKIENRLTLVLSNKEVIEEALVRKGSEFSGRYSCFSERCVNANRKGLMSNESRMLRKQSLTIMKNFGFGDKRLMESEIIKEIEEISKYADETNGQPFVPKGLILLATSNVIMNILFGRRDEYADGVNELAHLAAMIISSMDLTLDVAPLLRHIPSHRNTLQTLMDSQAKLFQYLEEEIRQSEGDVAPDCFLKRYLDTEGPHYDKEQLLFLLRDLLMGATDSSVSTLLYLFGSMANNPEIQNRVQAEIDSVIAKERLPSAADQPNLRYVEATIMEAMRRYTLGPIAVPHLTTRDVELRGFFIPADTVVLPNLYAVHMDPKIWHDPDVFRPERFLDENNNVVGRDRIIPFSMGPRACPGELLARLEVFLIFAGIMQHFSMKPPEGQTHVTITPHFDKLGSPPSHFEIRMIRRN